MDTPRPITLVLADNHGIVREGITAFCNSRPDLRILDQTADGEEAVKLILNLEPDFAVLDLNMPGIGGLEIIRRVRQAKSQTKLLVLSISRDENVIREVFRHGGNGYILKDGPARHLFDAIACVQDGGHYLTPLIRRDSIVTSSVDARQGIETPGIEQPGRESARKEEPRKEKDDPLGLLSKREIEVFAFLVDGMRPKDIAKTLNISPKTVDTYRANIIRKLEVDGIAGLVRFAIQQNLQPGASRS